MANDPLSLRSYYAGLSANFAAKSKLADLITAIYTANSVSVPVLSGCEIMLFAIAGNGQSILIGDEFLTTTNYGYVLAAGASRRYGPYRMNSAPLGDIYVMAADGTTAVKLGIEVVPC